jgi:3-keto-5-aminohexanoate cleavage enzyme
MEVNPFLRPGEYARTNAELVEKIVRIAKEVGREIASPEEARKIVGLN